MKRTPTSEYQIGEYRVTGVYIPATGASGHRHEPPDTPPEPAAFCIESVINEDGREMWGEISTEELEQLEADCLALAQEDGR